MSKELIKYNRVTSHSPWLELWCSNYTIPVEIIYMGAINRVESLEDGSEARITLNTEKEFYIDLTDKDTALEYKKSLIALNKFLDESDRGLIPEDTEIVSRVREAPPTKH